MSTPLLGAGFPLLIQHPLQVGDPVPKLVRQKPALAQEAPELLLTEPPGIVMFGQILTFGLLTLGWLILGAAILRARAYPRVATALVMVGAVVQALPFLPPAIGVPGAVIFDVSVAWLGFVLLTGRGAATEQQTSRVR